MTSEEAPKKPNPLFCRHCGAELALGHRPNGWACLRSRLSRLEELARQRAEAAELLARQYQSIKSQLSDAQRGERLAEERLAEVSGKK